MQNINKCTKTILFYGPIGGNNHIGGGESGNRKTINLLKRLNFNIIVLKKPYPVKTKLFGGLNYGISLLLSCIKFAFMVVKNRNVSLHLSGFYHHLIYIEYLFITIAKLFKVNSVYELRAGGAVELFENGGILYRRFFKKTIQKSNYILCQGLPYVSFLKKEFKKDGLYYPNFIPDDKLTDYINNNRQNANQIKLVYFGRIVPSKNIEFIIEICKNLQGLNYHLEIIGGGDNNYITLLIDKIDTIGLTNRITITPPKGTEEIATLLQHKHFFLFPSMEKREGHSNSLTEAMSRGVVPIVSNAGFNSLIVNQQELIVMDFDAQRYATIVLNIWNEGRWYVYSKMMHDLVKENFTENAVTPALLKSHYI